MADDPTLSGLAGVRVLVVKDHEDSRDILQQALTHEGALVSTAASAREALAQIAAAVVVLPPGDSAHRPDRPGT